MSTWQLHTGQNQMGQVEFRKLLAQNLIYNTHYNEITDKTPDKKRKQHETGHCLIMLPKGKNFPKHESSQQNVNILRTNALDARNECAPTAYVPQVSFGVQNVSDIILHAPKTILQHPAELSRLKGQKNGMPMIVSILSAT